MLRLPIGRRIRDRRVDRGVTQSALAGAVGISASYLNLIEHDKRQIGGALLGRIAKELGIDVAQLSGSDDTRMATEIREVARSNAIPGLDEGEALKMAAQNPEWARMLLDIHRRYLGASEMLMALSDRLAQDPALMELSHAILTHITSIRSFAEILDQHPDIDVEDRVRFSGIIASQSDRLGSSVRSMINLLSGGVDAPQLMSPEKIVDDFINWHGNHFPELEDAASELRKELDRAGGILEAAITERLDRQHGISIRAGNEVEDPAVLSIDEWSPPATARFRKARKLVELEMGDILKTLTEDTRLTTEESRNRSWRALAGYAAGALLFPYAQFHDTAEEFRYDVDRLCQRFNGSFEQVAHRLVTLRRPGAEGIPFAFLRTDPAGNISKPYAIPGLPMPRFGGVCPLWAIYQAFLNEGRTITQMVSTPQGEHFLFIARRLSKRISGFSDVNSVFSVMLGCNAAHASRTVYGDSYPPGNESLVTPVGINCRTCDRKECPQRAHPMILGA